MIGYKEAARLARASASVVSVRLVLEGTRVVIITDPPEMPRVSGTISTVRTQTQLKPYLVTCDDGTVRYASGHDLALEGDPSGTPLAPRPIR